MERKNTTSLERGLAEDLLHETVSELQRIPLRAGLVEPHAAPSQMLTILGSTGMRGDMQTAAWAVHGPIRIHRGDCVLYIANAAPVAGDVWFLVDGSYFGGPHACVGNWRRLAGGSSSEFWKFTTLENEPPIMVPFECIMATCICHGIGSACVTVLVPRMFR